MPLTPPTPTQDEALAFLAERSEACWKSALQAVFGPSGPALEAWDGAAAENDCLWFSCEFTPAQLGPLWFGLDRASALELGRLLLVSRARASEHEHHALYATGHLLGQLASSLARSLSTRLNADISAGDCTVAQDPPASGHHVQLPFGSLQPPSRNLTVHFPPALVAAIASPAASSAALVPASAMPRNLDLLLDLEMPVSISFGSTRIALKDVAKLNTGSIVELNRALSEPVDVVVNNCAIARGEVVVVDGNFAVRISEVVSKQDRLRSLS